MTAPGTVKDLEEVSIEECFALLDSREGASDSDVEALERSFGLSESEAGSIYRRWLNRKHP